jgi:hypothetical protein
MLGSIRESLGDDCAQATVVNGLRLIPRHSNSRPPGFCHRRSSVASVGTLLVDPPAFLFTGTV